jgi:hypothetical protein
MLARGERCQRQRQMKARRHRDDNGIDVAIFNGRRVVAVGAGAAEVLAEGVRLGQRAAGVAGDDL